MTGYLYDNNLPFQQLNLFFKSVHDQNWSNDFYKRDKNFTKIMTDIKGITENINKWK
jgi:hypothetical protein